VVEAGARVALKDADRAAEQQRRDGPRPPGTSGQVCQAASELDAENEGQQ